MYSKRRKLFPNLSKCDSVEALHFVLNINTLRLKNCKTNYLSLHIPMYIIIVNFSVNVKTIYNFFDNYFTFLLRKYINNTKINNIFYI